MAFLSWLPRADHCCCCINLRTGAIILGIFSILGSFLNVATSCVIFSIIITEQNKTPNGNTDALLLPKLGCIALFVASVIGLMVSIMYLIGAVKRRIVFIKVFVVMYLIVIIGMAVLMVVLVILFAPIQVLIPMIVPFCLHSYFLCCINSYLQELMEAEDGGRFATLE